jgi:dienelactone hydrolase
VGAFSVPDVPEALRTWRLALVVFAVTASVTVIATPGRSEAQSRAIVVLSTTLDTPVLSWTVRQLTGKPRIEETEVAGSPATLARPAGSGPWPAIMFVNGATRLGRREPEVQKLANGLARAGYLVLVPDLRGLPGGELSDTTVATTVQVARAVADRTDVSGSRVALVGVSVGATLALLAAEAPELADRVSLVAAIAPYTDLKEVIRLATTGYFRQGNLLIRYATDPYVGLVVARSLAAALPPSSHRQVLLDELRRIPDDDPDPLARLEASLPPLPPEARPVLDLLENRDPMRFDALYAALPAELRAGIARLSPITRAARLRAPVELASSPHDKYFPVSQSRALLRPTARARLTVTSAFVHVVPRPSLSDPGDLFRFDGWVVRSLDAAG